MTHQPRKGSPTRQRHSPRTIGKRVALSTCFFALFGVATFEWEFWVLFIALVSITLILYKPDMQHWWHARHDGRCDCRHCGYNLTGNVSGRCPECGKETNPDSPL